MGGSNGIGSWGYINGVDELMNQLQSAQCDESSDFALDHIVFATGSGGTVSMHSSLISIETFALGSYEMI